MSSFIVQAEGASTPPADYNGSRSPEAPPYSPITPPLEAQQLPPLDHGNVAPPFMEKPPEPVNLDMASNTDAMALRAALSALQVQRLKAIDHMKVLEQQKSKALSDPGRFARGLADGLIKTGEQVSPLAAALATTEINETNEEDEASTDEEDTEMEDADEDPTVWKEGEEFGTIPAPQNVVRMPPVNWAKYKIVGEALDSLHHEQTKRPDTGQARKDPTGRLNEHMVAAPYSPWRDKLPESSMRTRSDAKKP